MDIASLLRGARTVLLVDWPSRDVPDTLARAGYTVIVHGGPNPDDFFAHESRDGEIFVRRTGQAPAHADLVYVHRPVGELAGIVARAKALGATALWYESGVHDPRGSRLRAEDAARARHIVESAGLVYIDDAYIADAVRGLDTNA